MAKIKVIIKKHGRDAYVASINDDLQTLQQHVGGYIECIELPLDNIKRVNVICNDEGKIRKLPANFVIPQYWDIITGDAIIAADDGRGDFTDLSKEQEAAALAFLRGNSV